MRAGLARTPQEIAYPALIVCRIRTPLEQQSKANRPGALSYADASEYEAHQCLSTITINEINGRIVRLTWMSALGQEFACRNACHYGRSPSDSGQNPGTAANWQAPVIGYTP